MRHKLPIICFDFQAFNSKIKWTLFKPCFTAISSYWLKKNFISKFVTFSFAFLFISFHYFIIVTKGSSREKFSFQRDIVRVHIKNGKSFFHSIKFPLFQHLRRVLRRLHLAHEKSFKLGSCLTKYRKIKANCFAKIKHNWK